MKITNINNSIVRVHFETQKELTKTFIKIQEHYESPEFRGKIFTLGQFRE